MDILLFIVACYAATLSHQCSMLRTRVRNLEPIVPMFLSLTRMILFQYRVDISMSVINWKKKKARGEEEKDKTTT